MSKYIKLNNITDPRGSLSVLDQGELDFDVQRIFYIKDVPLGEERGGHRHKLTRQVLICVQGSCVVDCHDGETRESYKLAEDHKALVLEPEDYHIMKEFSAGTILLVLASHSYDKNDYIHEDYS